MTRDETLLQAIIAVPDDHAPRLVYIDWLTAQGDVDQAAFIWVQCALEHRQPIRRSFCPTRFLLVPVWLSCVWAAFRMLA